MSGPPSIGVGINIGPVSVGASIGLPSLPGLSLPNATGAGVFRDEIQVLIGDSQSTMKDVSSLFPPLNKLSIHYEDPISFQADTLDLVFEDIGDHIIKSANINKGKWLKIKILQYNRDYPGSIVQKDLGSFMIDQIKQSWPYSQTTLMGSSVPIDQQIKLTLQNKTRFAVSIRDLGQQVASENGLAFQWQARDTRNRILNEAQQWNESDLQMLSKVCKANALSFKIKDINGKQTLVIFDEQDLEQQAPVYTVDFSLPGAGIFLTHGELTTQSQDIYSTSTLSYYDAYANTVYVASADAPPDTAVGTKSKDTVAPVALKTFEHKNIPVDGSGAKIAKEGDNSQSTESDVIPDLGGKNAYTQSGIDNEAEMILRAKNIKEFHSVLTTAGTICFPNGVAIDSGVVILLKNKGLFDGKWIIQKVTIHTSENKLICDMELRKCIVPQAGTTVTPVAWSPITPGGDEEN